MRGERIARVGLFLIGILLFACNKELAIFPKSAKTNLLAKLGTRDTVVDNAEIKIGLMSDSVNSDETAIVFNHSASASYNLSEDAPYFGGFGQVNLATMSDDGRPLAINTLPFKAGMTIELNVNVKNDGLLTFRLTGRSNIPSGMVAWLKDKAVRDSVNILSTSYTFNAQKSNTSSILRNRFELVLKNQGSMTKARPY